MKSMEERGSQLTLVRFSTLRASTKVNVLEAAAKVFYSATYRNLRPSTSTAISPSLGLLIYPFTLPLRSYQLVSMGKAVFVRVYK